MEAKTKLPPLVNPPLQTTPAWNLSH